MRIAVVLAALAVAAVGVGTAVAGGRSGSRRPGDPAAQASRLRAQAAAHLARWQHWVHSDSARNARIRSRTAFHGIAAGSARSLLTHEFGRDVDHAGTVMA